MHVEINEVFFLFSTQLSQYYPSCEKKIRVNLTQHGISDRFKLSFGFIKSLFE